MGHQEPCHSAAPDPPAAPAAPPDRREYLLSASLQQLATLAPTLKEAELRVLLHLTATAAAAGSNSVPASSRDLEAAVRIARSAIQPALDALAKRGLIATRQGTPRSPAVHLLRFLEVATISGPVTGPPPDQQTALFPQDVALLQGRRGPLPGPPPTEFQQLPAAAEIVDSEGVLTLEGIIDRLSRAKPKDFDLSIVEKTRRWLHGYRLKFPLADEAGRPPHPPDDRIVAQFLSMADGKGGFPRLEAMLYDLLGERKQAYSYAWFVTVAAQRIHGIDPRKLKAKREELKLVRDQQREASAIAADELPDIQRRVEALAARRKLRR